MLRSQTLAIRISEVRQRLNEIAGLAGDALTEEIRAEADTLTAEFRNSETQYRAAIVAEGEVIESAERRHGEAGGDVSDGESAEFRVLQSRVTVRGYVDNVMGNFRSSTPRSLHVTAGAESEFNQAIGLGPDHFPLRLLAPPQPEVRAATATDTTTIAKRWLDRLFAGTVAESHRDP